MSDFAARLGTKLREQLGASAQELEFVGGFENFVYRLEDGSGARIVRLTHETHRSQDQLEAELEWLGFLDGRDIPVARALLWPSGESIEEVRGPDEASYWATSFEVAPGRAVDVGDEDVWNASLFERWGELFARMHLAAEQYRVEQGRPRRPQWHEDGLLAAHAGLGDEHAPVIEAGLAIVEQMKRLPVADETYGLVHSDLHHGNFFVSETGMTAFDFDDAVYHHFVHDLAIALYYACWWSAEGDAERQNAFAATFMRALLRGYRRHREMPAELLADVPLFLALRDWALYLVIHKRLDVATLAGPMKAALAERKARLLGGGAKIELDFGAL